MNRRWWMKSVLFIAVAASVLPACTIGTPEHVATAVAEDDSTVLDTLSQEHDITTVQRRVNGMEKTYAVSINEVSEDANLYWLFYVDGILIKDQAIDEAVVQKGQKVSAYFVSLKKNTN